MARAESDLSTPQALLLDFRASLKLIPFGIGSAIDARVFGALEEHRKRQTDHVINYLIHKTNALESRQIDAIDVNFFFSDEFTCLFRDCWEKIWITAQKQKLQALGGSLFSLIIGQPALAFDAKHFFIKSLGVIDDPHIQVLRILENRHRKPGKQAYYEMQELYRLLGLQSESDQNLIYSAMDVLANRRFVEHGNIPQGTEGKIITEKQRFRITALGIDFLSFIRWEDMPLESA